MPWPTTLNSKIRLFTSLFAMCFSTTLSTISRFYHDMNSQVLVYLVQKYNPYSTKEARRCGKIILYPCTSSKLGSELSVVLFMPYLKNFKFAIFLFF